jgi:histone H3
MRFQASALGALHKAAEAFLIYKFECVNLAAIHANRKTVMPKDFTLVDLLQGPVRSFTI